VASVVDHIVAHKGDASLFWKTSNHRSLCKNCHDKRVDEGDFGVEVVK
jgi:5-methylcytosine-specific restriction enzyme A